MYLKMTCIAASVLAISRFASAGIVYSGEIEEYTDGSPVSIDIAGLNYEFGIEVAGPADYAYITTTDEGAGIFVPIANELLARNFCTSFLASGPVIHWLSPFFRAVLPSRDMASFRRT